MEIEIEITGTVKVIGQIEFVSDSFSKRRLVVETQEQYPQLIPIEFVKEKTELLSNLTVGDVVTVGINLRGREWNGKYFLNAQGWKIRKTGAAHVESSPVSNNDIF